MAKELRKSIHIARVEVLYKIGDGDETYTAIYRDDPNVNNRFGKIEQEWTLSSASLIANELLMLSMFNELMCAIKEGQDGCFNCNNQG